MESFLDRFLQMLHQNIRNCLYFDWLFTHYVVMSDLNELEKANAILRKELALTQTEDDY